MNDHALIKIATLCVLRYKNKFLLLKRFNEPNKGKYVPVGGKLKNYESPTQGVIRETFEETKCLSNCWFSKANFSSI